MSKKKKGLSADEKRSTILSIYHTYKEPFNLKEIETLASKQGVVLQTVKDQNQSLVDDFLVMSDKLGASNFFWSFPSQSFMELKAKRDRLQFEQSQLEAQISTSEAQILELKRSRSGNISDRKLKIDRLNFLRQEEKSMEAQLQSSKSSDPVEYERIKSQTQINKAAADRWTDNVWSVKRYLTKKKGMSGKEVDRMLGIDGSFDYLVYSGNKSKKMKV